jgi:hypothetical protein
MVSTLGSFVGVSYEASLMGYFFCDLVVLFAMIIYACLLSASSDIRCSAKLLSALNSKVSPYPFPTALALHHFSNILPLERLDIPTRRHQDSLRPLQAGALVDIDLYLHDNRVLVTIVTTANPISTLQSS